ncbi:MAG: hypothetical protein K6C32_01700, partial [Bacilli bacterium]|nr:hypothetical protein [Bacilli bacterium]
VKTIQTNFNREYIKQWNEFARKSKGVYKTVSDDIKVGLKVQKDFYGNGFTINMHNLTYPYSQIQTTDQNNQTQIVPKLTEANIFRGPLPYYCLGDPNKMPIVTAYGQDNVGMYVTGKNITIDDLALKSCDFGNNLANLDTVGTTMEVYGGENITIKNCRLSNGKTVFKSYDSKNVELDNCLLSYSRNFLVMSGSYEYESVSGSKAVSFTTENGQQTGVTSLNSYLAAKGLGDTALSNYMYGKNEGGHTVEAMNSIQNALDANAPYKEDFKGQLTIRDTLFYRSGISSIALESLFNGPFLFNATPSIITDALGRYSGEMDEFGIGIPYIPLGVGGCSYPVNITLAGKTKFYDYKTPNVLDINGLVGENISQLAASAGFEQDISLDTIFPIKTILLEEANKNNRKGLYKGEINSPIAYYGGGKNQSTVTYADDFEDKDYFTETFDVNFLERYSTIGNMGEGLMANIFGAVLKAVTVVSGFKPFKFALMSNGHLYGETPQVQTLIDNANKVEED